MPQPEAAGALQTPETSAAATDPPATVLPEQTAAAPPASTRPSVPGPGSTQASTGSEVPSDAAPAPVDRRGRSEKQLAEIPQPVASAVALDAKKTVRHGVSAAVGALEAVQGEAQGVGEIAGPALRFRVTITNETQMDLSLAGVLVNVSFGADELPAGELSGPGTAPFPASVPPGGTAEAVYVFSVPEDSRDAVRIYFSLDAETPIAAFAGKAPD
ncbi:hypothetical protein ACIQC0_01130 [Pseudarthrobacter sp. NPDC092419]|uniref:hypothetical protein n=1 Tax=Pseudarthrobacter sp. NPDC092419 TaxID=3364414 RepID=UPI00381A3551